MDYKNLLVWDIETTGVDYKRDKFRLGHINLYTNRGKNLSKSWSLWSPNRTLEILTQFTDSETGIVTHNGIAFDLPFLFHACSPVVVKPFIKKILEERPKIYDTLALSRLYSSGEFKHSLAAVAQRFGLGEKVQIDDWKNVDDETLKERAKVDVALTKDVYDAIYKQCVRRDKYYKYHNNYYLLCIEMNFRGIPVNVPMIKETKSKLSREISTKYRNFVKNHGRYNVKSSKQMVEMAKKYGVEKRLPVTKKGNPSFNKDNKVRISSLHPAFEEMYDLRESIDIVNNYFSKKNNSMLDTRFDHVTGRDSVYPVSEPHKQKGLRTSVVTPAMMNYPKKLRYVCAHTDVSWVGIDVKALEVNVLAHILKENVDDPTLAGITSHGGDFKASFAATLGSLIDNIPVDDRLGVAKQLFFAKVYGAMPDTLAYSLRLPASYGQEIDDCIGEFCPGLSALRDYYQDEYYEYGCVYNFFGYSLKPKEHAFINGVVQSTGSNYCNWLLSLCRKNYLEASSVHPVIHVHDELQQITSLPPDEAKSIVKLALNRAYIELSEGGIPVFSTCEILVGDSWATSH